MKKSDMLFILILSLLATVVIVGAVVTWCRSSLPPMTGYIDNKTYHPAYFPADQDTPWVYCLGITSADGRSATSWKVSKEVYDSYNIGDLTGKPSNVKGGDF